MNKRGYIIVVGLLSLFVLLTACANNRMAETVAMTMVYLIMETALWIIMVG